jgi:hypothetical protein
MYLVPELEKRLGTLPDVNDDSMAVFLAFSFFQKKKERKKFGVKLTVKHFPFSLFLTQKIPLRLSNCCVRCTG